MFVEFDSLPDSSRIWVYQSAKKFLGEEENAISNALRTFTEEWVAHGQPLKCSFTIFHHQFIVLAADESYNEASGCSIDDSVHAVKEIGKQCGLELFNRTGVAFLKDDKVEVFLMNELQNKIQSGHWDKNTLVFNNLVSSKGDLSKNWIVPAGQTWLKRYLAKIAV